jgi:hypothetical protein
MIATKVIDQFLEQLNSIISEYDELKGHSKYDDLSDLGDTVAYSLMTRSRAAVERTTGKESVYSQQIEEILEIERKYTHDFNKLQMILGVVQSLKTDVESGYLESISELLHSEVFADFLEMGDYLLSEGYKDAAAVIAGGTLEAHLRQLCSKHGIDTEITTARGVQPKKADQMNSDLTKKHVITKLDQKNVTAWLDLRNKAAHGKYEEYTSEQVTLLIAGIRDFLTRCPA